MSDAWPTVEKFGSEFAAEMARGALEAAGIPAVIWKDDAGGMYPNFQLALGVRLRVAPEDEQRALEILADLRAEADPGTGDQGDLDEAAREGDDALPSAGGSTDEDGGD